MLAMRPLRALAVLALAALPAAAAEITLDNGDRITGTVVALADGKLQVDTEWGGTLEIDFSRIARLTTEAEIRVVLDDDSELAGTATVDDQGRTLLGSAGVLDLARVATINPPVVPPFRWSGGASFGLASTSGNTDTQSAHLDAKLVRETARHRLSAAAALNEAENDGVESAARRYLGLGYDRLTEGPWYFTADAGFTDDSFQDLDLRTTFGIGVGHQFWSRDDSRLSTEIGVSYVDENFITAPDDDYTAARWGLDLEHALRDGVTFFHGHDLLVSVEDTDDLLLNSRTGLRFGLFGKLVSTIQYGLAYDESPAPGREKDDTSLLVTFGYAF